MITKKHSSKENSNQNYMFNLKLNSSVQHSRSFLVKYLGLSKNGLKNKFTVTLKTSGQAPPTVSVLTVGPSKVNDSKSSRNQQTSEKKAVKFVTFSKEIVVINKIRNKSV